jgi:DedD protein
MKTADAKRVQALLEAKPAAAPGQFVLQLGAFEQAAAARETRGKAEKLGFKVFEQTIDAGGGARRIRVRIGPYGNRDEAERMLHKLQASGLTASVMPL